MFDRSILPQVFSALTATLGAMAIGTILAWTASAQEILPDEGFSFTVTKDDASIYGPAFGVGAILGALPAGLVSGRIGSRRAMALYEVLVVVGWVLLIFPRSVWVLVVGRIFQGVGVGALCSIIPVYVAEISQPNIRGSLSAVFQVFVTIGIFYVNAVGAIRKYFLLNILCGMWTIIHVIGAFFIVESPYYLLKKNEDEKAAGVLKILRSNGTDTAKELAAIKKEIEMQKTLNNSFVQVTSDKVNRKALIIGIGCMFFQQISGINILIFYLKNIFDTFGSNISSDMATIIISVVQIVVTCLSMVVIDKVGRRLLLVISAVLMGISFLGLASCLIAINLKVNIGFIMNWLPIAFVALYIAAFSVGFGPVPWVIMGEIFSIEVKPYGTSFVTVTNWVMVFVTTFFPPMMVPFIGLQGIFIMFGLFCLSSVIFIVLIVPETKNKSLVQIQIELIGHNRSTSANEGVV